MRRAASSGARRAQSGAMAQGGQARLREALQAGGPGSQKEKGPPVADGILTVTPDTPEAVEWRTRRSIIDSAGASSSYLEDESGAGSPPRLQRPEQTPKRELACLMAWARAQAPSPRRCMASSPGRLKTSARSASASCAARCSRWAATSGARPPRACPPEPPRPPPSCSVSAACAPAGRYILVYPQGCDVCNHLSLFLCVADYDKLLPGARLAPPGCRPAPARLVELSVGRRAGWSHFAQFTIAVVNKDPKKSKYSGAPPHTGAFQLRSV